MSSRWGSLQSHWDSDCSVVVHSVIIYKIRHASAWHHDHTKMQRWLWILIVTVIMQCINDCKTKHTSAYSVGPIPLCTSRSRLFAATTTARPSSKHLIHCHYSSKNNNNNDDDATWKGKNCSLNSQNDDDAIMDSLSCQLKIYLRKGSLFTYTHT